MNNNSFRLIATMKCFCSEPTKEYAVEAGDVKKTEEEEMQSPRPRLSSHSLSLSGSSALTDLIAKARSEFSQSLQEVSYILIIESITFY